MNSRYSIKSFIVFWGFVFCAIALFFSIFVTQVFFNSYILNSSFKELRAFSIQLNDFMKDEVSKFEDLQSEKLQSDYFLKNVQNLEYNSINQLLINWKEAHRIQDIFIYNQQGELIDLKNKDVSKDGVKLSNSQFRFLKKGGLSSQCLLNRDGVLIDVSRQIRSSQGESLGFLSQRKKINFKQLVYSIEGNFLVAADQRQIFFNSINLNLRESEKILGTFINQKLSKFVLTVNGEKYDFIKLKSCGDFNFFIGKKNLQQEVYFNFYKKFFPFLVFFILIMGILFAFSFYRQILKPLQEINEKIISKENIKVETNISEIEAISKMVHKEISGLEEKVQETHEGRKRDISRLVASVAHELNNSLSYLGGNLEYLDSELKEESPDLPEVLDALKSARTGFVQIKKIVSDLKVFSSVGSILKKEFSLDKIEERLLKIFPDVKFEGFTKEQIIDSDFERVNQILVNLIQNSYTASPQKDPAVKLSVEKAEESLKIYVEDQAGGIPKELQDKIFEPFFTTKKTEGGTGLGLSLSQNLAQSLEGNLSLVSSDAKGSVFCLTLSHERPK